MAKNKKDSSDTRGEGEKTGFVNLKMTTLRTDLAAGFNCLMGNYREDGTRLFSKASNEKTISKRDKSQEGKSQSYIRKKIFTMKMLRHWNKLPRDVMESQNSKLRKILSNLL